jgi:predicted dehydrogenase
MRVGIIGCGLIGRKRAETLSNAVLTVCCDTIPERADSLAGDYGARSMVDWRSAASSDEVDAICVATTHDMLPRVAEFAAAAGKHVLIEKPGGRSAAELEPVREAAMHTGALVRIGFNHRYHRAFQKAREFYENGALGELMFIRARYGHGGRLGYEKEWRAKPEFSGGGEGIDQGVHLVDLARWFLGDFTCVQGHAATYYWDMPVDDNSFYLLRTASNQTAFLHASWTEWKNTFSFEIYGKLAKLEISGFGGSYGTERLAYYRLTPDLGPPETTIFEYPMADDSWNCEWREFLNDVRLRRQPQPGIADAQAALRIVQGLQKVQGLTYHRHALAV